MKDIVWFSCGAASAIMSRIMSKQLPDCHIVYCATNSEDKDNVRFLKDIENWTGRTFEIVTSEKYKDVNDVIEKTRFINGHFGARCTTELKINVRLKYADINDTHYWGFCLDEGARIEKWKKNNFKIINSFPLQHYQITKQMCYAILEEAGIELPRMYRMGLNHNNCICCNKATSPKYWNIMRINYPEDFKIRCEQSRLLNYKMVRVKGDWLFLDELDPMDMTETDIDISCDLGCQAIYNTIIS